MKQRLTILYSGGGWISNVGNAFIDYGCIYSLKKAIPNCNLYATSNLHYRLIHDYKIFTVLSKNKADSKQKNILNLRNFINADYYVFSGSMLHIKWFKIFWDMIKELAQKNSRIIIYGGGGVSYSQQEIDTVREYLKKLNLFAFISRDEKAFKYYKDLAKYAYNGIDCGFFVNDYFTPPKLEIAAYIILAFDKFKSREPNIATEKKIIRIHHSPWDIGRFKFFIKSKIKRLSVYDFCSDNPEDYLTLYCNCDATYSDRVHACVAALSYGKRARYYTRSLRSLLFDQVGLSDIRRKLVHLDKEKILEKKKRQIEFLQGVLKSERW